MDWDAKYLKTDTLLYGNRPSQMVVCAADAGAIPDGTVLFAGDGEGRHSRWLAARGYDVTAIDISAVATGRALDADSAAGVTVRRIIDNVSCPSYSYPEFTSCFMLYLHFSVEEQTELFNFLRRRLATAAKLFIEGFGPEQLGYKERYNSGGPSDSALYYCPQQLKDRLHDFSCLSEQLSVETLDDGPGHQGPAQICRMIFEKN